MIGIRRSDLLDGQSKITVTVNGNECGVFWFRAGDSASDRAARCEVIGMLVGGIIREQVSG